MTGYSDEMGRALEKQREAARGALIAIRKICKHVPSDKFGNMAYAIGVLATLGLEDEKSDAE